MFKNIKIQNIYNNVKLLIDELNLIINDSFNDNQKIKNNINELNELLIIDNINNNSSDEIENNINEYMTIIQFCKNFQEKFLNIHNIIYKILKSDLQLKNKIGESLNTLYLNWISFSTDYIKLIQNIANECINISNNIIKKKENMMNEMNDETNAIINNVSSTNYDYSSAMDAIKQLGPSPNVNDVDNIINSVNSLSGRIALRIWRGFDILGDYINKGLDYLGEIIGSLISKLSVGLDNLEYSFNVLTNKGFDAFFNDSKCVSTLANTIIYSIIIYFGLKILRSILRRISHFTGWLGGRIEDE